MTERFRQGAIRTLLQSRFNNPNRVPFDYDLVFYSQLNSPPEITSVPDIEALTGKQYVYPVMAYDADTDSLKYRLTEAPAGMAIVEATGNVTWTPTVASDRQS